MAAPSSILAWKILWAEEPDRYSPWGSKESDPAERLHFPIRLLQNIEQSPLCYIVGHCWLSILNIAVCTCQSQTP